MKRNPTYMQGIERQMADRLMAAGDAVLQKAQDLIEAPKSGVFHPGNRRASSAPGESPASQDGDLLESLQRSDAVNTKEHIEVHVFSWLTRARMLEAGTATKAPRPFFRPALTQSKVRILQTMRGEGDG